MITYLSRLTAERDSLTEMATTLAETATTEDRDLTDTERGSLAQWQTRCAEIDGQLTEYNAQAESARAYARLRSEIDNREDEAAPPTGSRALATRQANTPALVDWGDAFVGSEAFRDYPGSGTSRRVEVPFDLEQRAAITLGDQPAGALRPFVYTPANYTYQSPLLDVVGKVTTSANAVQWLQWTPNPQAAASVVAEGELKPEATMDEDLVSASLETYAHWKAISRQALEDVPQIRSIIEGRLRQGIVVALETAVATALNAAPIPPVTGSAAGGDNLLGMIREGMATVQAAGYGAANAVLLNPADWAGIDVAIMGGTLGGPTVNNGFWGLRPIAVPSVPAGTAYVGNFATAVQLFTRSTADVFMTDSHADYFVRNLLLLLAEIRAKATVPDPQAAAKCTVGAVAAAASPSGGK
jgi:HK97 family phage major capsid protein